MAELEEIYTTRREEKITLPCDEVRYGLITPDVGVAQPLARTPFDKTFILFRGTSNPVPSVTASINVTSAFRGALMLKACGDGGSLPEVISGHRPDGAASENMHIAIIALPDVGHNYAEGSLKGVGIVLPAGLSVVKKDQVLRIIGALGKKVDLMMGKNGVWSLERDPSGGDLKTLDSSTWVGPAKKWATVTPIVLDRFPKKAYSDESASIISKSCVRMGLPAPAQVEVGPVSAFEGVPPVWSFVPYRKGGMPPRIHVHAFMSFEQDIEGPLFLGAGRYMGMGLCRPLR